MSNVVLGNVITSGYDEFYNGVKKLYDLGYADSAAFRYMQKCTDSGLVKEFGLDTDLAKELGGQEGIKKEIQKIYKELDHEIESSAKNVFCGRIIKSGIDDELIGESDNGEYLLYLNHAWNANHGQDPHDEVYLVHNGEVKEFVRTDDPYCTSVVEKWAEWYHINIRKPYIKNSCDIEQTFCVSSE